MLVAVIAVVGLSLCHLLIGLTSVCVGLATSVTAEVWLAHNFSPVWSGVVFIITGVLGFVGARRRTVYLIMWCAAFSAVCVISAIVSIQLLRLGLVNQTSDGQMFEKEDKDDLILVAIGLAGTDCFVCVLSALACWRLAIAARRQGVRKPGGTFHVQLVGEKELLVVTTSDTGQHILERVSASTFSS